MTPTHLRSLANTTATSSRVAALLMVVALGASAQAPSRRAAPREAPAPHLRPAAEPETDGGVAISAPEPIPGDGIGLAEILAFADEHSPALGVARSSRAKAAAARAGASQLLDNNPQVSVAVGPRFGISGVGADVEASLSQQIQIAGERGARLAAAERFAETTDAQIEQARWLVHCDVHAAFHRALVERERLRLADRVVAFQQEVFRIVRKQIAAGETAPLSLRLAEAEVAQATQAAVAARQAFLASRLRLAQLAGWPISKPPIPVGTSDLPRDPPPQDRLISVAQEKLPRLRAAAAAIREAQARSVTADREAWPRPSVGVQYRREGNPTSEGAYDVVMGVLSIPIPSLNTNQGARADARADVTVAQAELDAARSLLSGQIAEGRSEVVAAAQRTQAYGTEILPRFEENLTLLRRSFELGEIDLLALSFGRERFMRIQSDALGAQLDYFVALAGLERLVGVDLWGDDHHEEVTP